MAYDVRNKLLRKELTKFYDREQDLQDLLKLYQILEDKVVSLILTNQELNKRISQLESNDNLKEFL
jgi:hypothetical protein